jgi:hypothetical protein
MKAERRRLAEATNGVAEWKKWGPYLSERQWGTVREDLSDTGDAWNDFPHDQARARAYRWGEDGLAGLSDDRQQLCFALALWNGADPILKERLFGLTNNEGNHGEDCKEYYFYLDATPTHSYLRYLYKYPHAAYPYEDLLVNNKKRSRHEAEFELVDTGIFAQREYFDVFVEYAKAAPEDIFIAITVINRGDAPARLHVLPTLWFRNIWVPNPDVPQPNLAKGHETGGSSVVIAIHHELGDYYLYCDGDVPLIFTANETNNQKLFARPNRSAYVKDAFNDFVVHGQKTAVNPAATGTKAAAHYQLSLPAGGRETMRLRLSNLSPSALRTAARGGIKPLAALCDQTVKARREEADAFYADIIPATMSADERLVMRQALAGMLWTKQVYIYDVAVWLKEHGVDPIAGTGNPLVRNRNWYTLEACDVISMPDKWEYPWFAAWDLAFHSLPLAMVDPEFAKEQLSLMLSRRYLNPNGQIPAYEWNFSDVNPPVHAWATRFVFHLDRQINGGSGDLAFYTGSFTQLLANFTWWLNRKDPDGNNIFGGGFLGLDNIGVFDRSSPLPTGGSLDQSDGTAWMAFYAAQMFSIAVDLAATDTLYVDWAERFLDAFLRIAVSMDRIGLHNDELWDEEDGFFYDVLRFPNGQGVRLKVRSVAGLLPLCALVVLPPPSADQRIPDLQQATRAFFDRHPRLAETIAPPGRPGIAGRQLLAVVGEGKLRRILARLLDPNEFLSDFGLRSLSRVHAEAPYTFSIGRETYQVAYEPAESQTGMFGGNSNWRGPVWIPMNLLIIEALLKYYTYYGDDFRVEFPTGSGETKTLFGIAAELSRRLTRLFLLDPATGTRPALASLGPLANDANWRDFVLFYEYFHGDNGRGLGASHQTGWTGAIATLMRYFATITAEMALSDGTPLYALPPAPPKATAKVR